MRWRITLLPLLFSLICMQADAVSAQNAPKKPVTKKAAPPATTPKKAAGPVLPPANSSFRLVPLPGGGLRRVALLAEKAAALDSTTFLDLYAGDVIGALPKIGRGVEADSRGGLPEVGNTLAARLKGASAALIRIAPFRANAITTGVNGAVSVRWETADAALQQVAESGADAILDLTPPRALPTAAWVAFVTQAAQRYANRTKFPIARWELACGGESVERFYGAFAKTVREALPTTPIGFALTEGEPTTSLQALASLCIEDHLPCDSFSWRVTGTPLEAVEILRRLRAALTRYPSLKTLTLWPAFSVSGSDEESPAAYITMASRLAEAAPPDQPNPLGGALLALSSGEGEANSESAAVSALALLNRTEGARLRAESTDNETQVVAARAEDGTLSAVVWREGDASGEKTRLLRLHGLPPASQGAYRLELYAIGPRAAKAEKPGGKANAAAKAAPPKLAHSIERIASLDLPGNGGDLEIPLALPPHAVLQAVVRPHRPPLWQISLESLRLSSPGGEEMDVIVTLKNLAKTPQSAEVTLSGFPADMVPASPRIGGGSVAPNGLRALRFHLLTPLRGQDSRAYLTAAAGDSHAALAVKILSPITATLDAPRVDLATPGGEGEVRVRLVNHTRDAITLFVRAPGLHPNDPITDQPIRVPGNGKAVVQNVVVGTAQTTAGTYPVDIELATATDTLLTLRALVCVPALCRYTSRMPVIDGDLRDWADGEPLGMGRPEQIHKTDWRGPGDLSAYAYARWDDNFLYFACAVTDDVHFQPFGAAEMPRGDSVLFAVSTDRRAPADRKGYGLSDHEFGMALLNGTEPVLMRLAGPSGSPLGPVSRAVVAIHRQGTRTFYEAAIPWSALSPIKPAAGKQFGFSIVVNDNDGQTRGYAEWGGGIVGEKRPGHFPTMRLIH